MRLQEQLFLDVSEVASFYDVYSLLHPPSRILIFQVHDV